MPDTGLSESILCIVCAGKGSNDARRVELLMGELGVKFEIFYVDKSVGFFRRVMSTIKIIRQSGADLVFLEGTGLSGGLPLIFARWAKVGPAKFIVSSGDAVDSYVRNRYGHFAALAAGAYEKCLYRSCFGFVGWSPYLVGRAIRMGAERGLTVEGFATPRFNTAGETSAEKLRDLLGIVPNQMVVGVTGTINWSDRQEYCYGLELVEAAKLVRRQDVRFLIVGDGTGLAQLKSRARDDARFIFTGRVPHEAMPGYLALLDAAVIAQTSDEVGSLRLTTKLPEYLAAGVPVAMSASPGAIDYLYELDASPVWLLKANHPASSDFARDIASWIEGLNPADVAVKRESAKTRAKNFELGHVAARLYGFLQTYEGVDGRHAAERRARAKDGSGSKG